jgi:ComF family protein
MSAWLHRAWNTALDLLLPPRCFGCGSLGSHWCADCNAGLRPVPEPICERCGLPKPARLDCLACAANNYEFTAARSHAVYADKLRRAILHLKRRRNEAVGQAFALHLAATFASTNWQVDVVSPIPLAERRFKERGFNQSGLLAKPLASKLDLVYLDNLLARRQETKPQFDLPREERWKNVDDVFSADAELVEGRTVLVVDDIMTTGATLNAAAKALKAKGAKAVYGLSLARALFESPGDSG